MWARETSLDGDGRRGGEIFPPKKGPKGGDIDALMSFSFVEISAEFISRDSKRISTVVFGLRQVGRRYIRRLDPG